MSSTQTRLAFDIISEIGFEGKNSQVYLAHDPQLNAEIVVKKIKKATFLAASEFYEESKKLYSSGHAHVVEIKYSCEDDDHIYLVMPFYPNGSLKKLIGSRFLTVREIIRYATQFLSGLHHIHTKGLIHFDVKPDNILLSKNNEAMLSDFGLAKSIGALGTAENDLVYKKQIPPEYFTQTEHTMLYDVYLAGLTLYRLCNGDAEFYRQFDLLKGDRAKYVSAIKSGAFPDRSLYLPHIPDKLRRIINRAMHIDQHRRYPTVLSLLNDLGTVSDLLDWQFVKTSPDEQEWLKNEKDRDFRVKLNILATGLGTVETHKTMKSSGKTMKLHACSAKNIAPQEIAKKVTNFLSTND